MKLVFYPLFEKERVSGTLGRLFSKLAALKEFEAREGEVFFAYGAAGLPEKLVLVGLGNAKKLNVSSVMGAFGAATKLAMAHMPKKIELQWRTELNPFAQAIGETLALANYQAAAAYKTGAASKKLKAQKIQSFDIIGGEKKCREAFKKGQTISNVVNEVRDWVNAGPNIANVKFFEEKAGQIAKETGAKLTILQRGELEKLNMGALLAVNRGSPDGARLMILDYNHDAGEPIVFVGKGILFDSGGYNLKPSGHIEDMQLDKAGAAAVIALIKLLPKFKIKRRVIAVAPLTENLIGPTSVKPSEIIKTYSGKTVEITNTDAEGRLVLSDAIAYAIDKFKPKYLIDVATLTGACVVALGERYAGLFGNDKELMENLRLAGEETDELLWPMPMHKDYSEKMKGFYADLCNSSSGSSSGHGAGASRGAAFLQEFVGKTKWAHLDIAGPAFVTDPKKYEQKGATGFGIRALLRFLEKAEG